MMDAVYIVASIVSFVVLELYAHGCKRVEGIQDEP